MFILPRLKSTNRQEGELALGQAVAFIYENAAETAFANNLLQEYFCRYYVDFPAAEGIPLSFKKTDGEGKKEFYSIKISSDGIEVGYSDALGARNAAATLIALSYNKEDKLFLPLGEVSDYPDSSYRGFMLDIARQYYPIDEIRMRLRSLARAKYNILHIHLLDTERYAIKTEVLPQLNTDPIFKQYTLEEMRGIVEYAASLGISVIPELDFPGHGLFMLEKMPELKCVEQGKPVGIWTLCAALDDTYTALEKLIGELVTVFDYHTVHMGGDELSFYDLKEYTYWPMWDKCDRCTTLSKEKDYKDTSDLFCHYVRRIHGILKSFGRRLMIWNDAIDISRTPDLPRDILMQFWRVAGEGRGPYEGCSMERFLQEGFDVVNSYFPETYIDDYIIPEQLAEWNPRTNPTSSEEYHGQILGGEMCAWGIRNHFQHTLPSAFLQTGCGTMNRSRSTAQLPPLLPVSSSVRRLIHRTSLNCWEACLCRLGQMTSL